jgi:hypothetical protein
VTQFYIDIIYKFSSSIRQNILHLNYEIDVLVLFGKIAVVVAEDHKQTHPKHFF